MKRLCLSLVLALLTATAAFAQTEIAPPPGDGTSGGGGSYPTYNLDYHGGKLMPYAKVVYLFWGNSFTSWYVNELKAFRDNSDAMPSAMGMLAQYSAPQGSLLGGQADVTDYANPPHTNVTKGDIQDELIRIFGFNMRTDTVYVVFLPNGYYATDPNGATSCGGPGTSHFCAYHYYFYPRLDLSSPVKYAVIPYTDANCSFCAKYNEDGVFATDLQNAEVMTLHEVREAMTDPTLSGWYDATGKEADDKCAFLAGGVDHPENVFVVRGFGALDAPPHNYWFQKEWSNAAHGCVSY